MFRPLTDVCALRVPGRVGRVGVLLLFASTSVITGPAAEAKSSEPNGSVVVSADGAGRVTGFPATMGPGVWQISLKPGTSVDSLVLLKVLGTHTDRQVRAAMQAGYGSGDAPQPSWLRLAGGTPNRTDAAMASSPQLVTVDVAVTKATATGFRAGSNTVLWTNPTKKTQALQIFSMRPGFGAADLKKSATSDVHDITKRRDVIGLDPGFSQLFVVDLSPGTYVFTALPDADSVPMVEIVIS